MKGTIYNPFAPSKTFGNFADTFFNRSIADFLGSDFMINSPSVNVIENGDSYRIELAAPGLEKSDFKVNVEDGYLKISVEREQKDETTGNKYTRREFNYASFKRSFQLPDTVDTDSIGASYNDGILVIALPKKEEEKTEETRLIEIK